MSMPDPLPLPGVPKVGAMERRCPRPGCGHTLAEHDNLNFWRCAVQGCECLCYALEEAKPEAAQVFPHPDDVEEFGGLWCSECVAPFPNDGVDQECPECGKRSLKSCMVKECDCCGTIFEADRFEDHYRACVAANGAILAPGAPR